MNEAQRDQVNGPSRLRRRPAGWGRVLHAGLGLMFAYKRMVMNRLFGSSMYSPKGPQ
jgi:hypothetical protein